eukprot:gene7660-15678_t
MASEEQSILGTSKFKRLQDYSSVSEALQPNSKINFCSGCRTITIFISLLFLSFGSHAVKSSLAVFQVYFIRDHWITTGGYGILIASTTLPGTFVPFLAGYLFDMGNYKAITLGLLLTALIGQFCFAIAVQSRVYWLACIAQFVCGVGVSCVNVVQKALISCEFKNRQSFAISCTVAMSCLAKFLGKAVTAPIVNVVGSYQNAVYVNCIYGIISLIAGLIFFSIEEVPKANIDNIPIEVENSDSLEMNSDFSDNIKPNRKNVIFFAPVVGLLIDKVGYGILICAISGISTSIAYYFLLFTSYSPIYGILMISTAEGLIPTITAALIPRTIPQYTFGIAFGIITVLDNIMNFSMDIIYGELYNLTGSYDIGLTVLFSMSVLGLTASTSSNSTIRCYASSFRLSGHTEATALVVPLPKVRQCTIQTSLPITIQLHLGKSTDYILERHHLHPDTTIIASAILTHGLRHALLLTGLYSSNTVNSNMTLLISNKWSDLKQMVQRQNPFNRTKYTCDVQIPSNGTSPFHHQADSRPAVNSLAIVYNSLDPEFIQTYFQPISSQSETFPIMMNSAGT